jgi:hypothetical protein
VSFVFKTVLAVEVSKNVVKCEFERQVVKMASQDSSHIIIEMYTSEKVFDGSVRPTGGMRLCY